MPRRLGVVWPLFGTLVLLSPLTGCGGDGGTKPDPESSGTSSPQQKIVFSSDRDVSQSEIYVMNADGSNVARLTNNSVNDEAPVLSPDGTKIAFRRELPPSTIYIMNVDGSSATPLTEGIRATWSPDGTRLAIAADSLYLINTNGSGKDGIVWAPLYPDWSPSGTKIAFIQGSTVPPYAGYYEIFVINTDGSDPQQITANAAQKANLAWSPDGAKLVFGQGGSIYTTNSDGTGAPDSLTNGAGAKWSPDGTRIVYSTSALDGNDEIYTIKLDGTNPLNLSNNPASDFDPDWGPRN